MAQPVTPKQWRFVHRIATGASVPAEGFLYATTLFASIWVAINDDPARQLFFPAIGLSEGFAHAWSVLMITGPLQAMFAGWLLTRRSGQAKVWGMWQRLAGNASITFGLLAFVVARLKVYALDPPEPVRFGVIMIAGFGLYASFLMLRDIFALVLLEQTTMQVERRGLDR